MFVHPSIRPSSHFHPRLSSSVLHSPLLSPSRFLFSQNPSLTRLRFSLLLCCPADSKCWHNISATRIVAAWGDRNIERTFPGPPVCASASPSYSKLLHLLSSSSSSCRCSDDIRMCWFCRFRVWWLQGKSSHGVNLSSYCRCVGKNHAWKRSGAYHLWFHLSPYATRVWLHPKFPAKQER